MLERTIMAGFGGQGLMFMGKLVAKMMMDEGFSVTYFPSYGAEVRGGTANCHVVISDDIIASPIVDIADTIIVMNQPSYEKFGKILSRDGAALVNASLVQMDAPLNAKIILNVPATQIAADLGDVRAANMVMLGAYNALREFVPFEKLAEYVTESFGAKKPQLVELNNKALASGRQFAEESRAKK